MEIKFKYLTLFLKIILFSNICISQSNNTTSNKYEDLDERNGFKIFTFGDSKQKYDGAIQVISSLGFNRDVKTYRYTNSEPYELFGAEWEKLHLGFTRRKLTNIEVRWKFSKNLFIGLKNELTEIFGEPEEWNSKMTYNYVWRGEKVLMKLTRESDEFVNEAKTQGLLNDFDLSVRLEIENQKLKGSILFDKKKGF